MSARRTYAVTKELLNRRRKDNLTRTPSSSADTILILLSAPALSVCKIVRVLRIRRQSGWLDRASIRKQREKEGICAGDVSTGGNNNSFELLIKYIKPLSIMILPTAKEHGFSSDVVKEQSNAFSTNQ